MLNSTKESFVIVMGLLVIVSIGLVFGYNAAQTDMRKQAIQVGAAYYNPTNAEFTWNIIQDKKVIVIITNSLDQWCFPNSSLLVTNNTPGFIYEK